MFLTGLSAAHDSLSQWYVKASSYKKSLQHAVNNFDKQTLTSIVIEGQNREHVGGDPSKDLGFQIALWNGQKGDAQASLSLRCGLYWKTSKPGVSVGNCVVLDLPRSLGKLANPERMSQLLATTAKSWKPDWAGVMSEASMLSRNFDVDVPFIDWMVYVPRHITDVPKPAFLLELQGEGSIIVVQRDPPTSGLQSLALLERVESVIKRAR